MTTELLTAAEAATRLGCTARTIARHCQRRGIGHRLTCGWVLTPQDLATLQAIVRRPGNPAFVAGNYFGGYKERP